MDSRFQVMDSEFQVMDSKFQVMDSRIQVMDSRLQVMDSGFQVMDSRFQVMDSRFQVMDFGFLVNGTWVPVSNRYSGIPDSKAQDSGFQKQNVSGIWITLQLHGTKRSSNKGRGIE